MKYRGISFGIFLSVLLFLCTEHSIADLIPVKASYGSLGLTQAILPLGKEAGMFKESGLNVETVYIAGKSVSALIGGDVQFSMMGGPPAVLARLAGVDLVILGGKNTLGQILVSSPSIKDRKDLVGKRGGISRFGTLSEYSLRVALRKVGLEAGRDVTIIQIGDTAARLGGLQSGAISVAVMDSGEEAVVRKLGFKILADLTDVPFLGSVHVSTETFIRKNADVVRVILDILREKGELKKRVEPSEFLNVGFLRQAAEVEKTK